jgi:cation transporter-like permease
VNDGSQTPSLPVGLIGTLEPLAEVWVYLSATPLFGLTLTLVTHVIADRVSVKTGRHPLANPVLWSVLAYNLMHFAQELLRGEVV